MKFGLHLPNFGPLGDPNLIATLAAQAEAAGWHGFFLWDHVLGDPDWREPMVDPWIALAAVASATSEMRLGALVTAVPRRRPWHLARETTTLDHLSGGRLIVGVGLGYPADAEFAHFGEDGDARHRAVLLDEGLAILAGLWRGKPFAFEGEAYHMKETVFVPSPVQDPRPPIWVGSHWPHRAPLRRAARWDGVFPEHVGGGRLSPIELTQLLDYVRGHRDSSEPFDIVVAGESSDLAPAELTAYEEAGATWWLESITPGLPLIDVEQRIRAGPPQTSPGLAPNGDRPWLG
jgi:alkanesulfonate monooxygenase SsuD/methylene tetrahydromethanopterin reductase-like flavin-dependent oxidoreductase (luciferase family)